MAVYEHTDGRFMASVGAGKTRTRRLFKTRDEALAWEASQKPSQEAPEGLPEGTPVGPQGWTLAQALDYVYRTQWCDKGKEKGGTRKAMLNANQALDFFGRNTPCSAIVTSKVMDYKLHLTTVGNGSVTKNKKLSALSMLLKAARDRGDIDNLPKLQRDPEAPVEPMWFRDEMVDRMLAYCTKMGWLDLHDFIVIGIDNGFRSGEILMLTQDMEFDGAYVLPAGVRKDPKPLRIPHSERVAVIAANRRDSGFDKVFPFLTPSVLRKQWEIMRAELGQLENPGFTPHKLRHTCASRMITRGVHMKVVQKWLGHTVIATTERYSHLADDAMDRARDQMATPKKPQPPEARP